MVSHTESTASFGPENREAQKGHKSMDVVSHTDLFQFKMFLLF